MPAESVRPVGPVDTCWCVNCNNPVRKPRAYVANVRINFALISPISNTYHYQHNNVMNYQRHWPTLSMNTFQWNTGKNGPTKVARYYLWTSVGSEQLSPAAVLTLTMINKARSHLADTVCICILTVKTIWCEATRRIQLEHFITINRLKMVLTVIVRYAQQI